MLCRFKSRRLGLFEEVLQRGVSDESTFKLCLKVMEISIRKRD